MCLFARVVARGSFTAASRELHVPKQTLSRRVAELEGALGVQLLHRTTRRVHPTAAGAAYAERCAAIARLADDANRAVRDDDDLPRGVLRVTADPVFGDAFVGALVVEYAARWPEVQLDAVFTRRRVDLVEEGFDVAFRVGAPPEPSLAATKLGPARVRFCASRAYLARRGVPHAPADLARHDCIGVGAEGAPIVWPVTGRRGVETITVAARLSTSSFAVAHEAALRGLGIALFPEFRCSEDVRARRLVTVMDHRAPDVGGVWLVHAPVRPLPARVRAFVELARERLAGAPWAQR